MNKHLRTSRRSDLSAKSRTSLARFKRFAAETIRQLEKGEHMVVFLHVARGVDDCPKGPPPGGDLYVSFRSQMIKGPPYNVAES